MPDPYDLAIIGGGINGCGIARDASGRGLTVVLAEMGDLAGATSSASTKLIHGGLRYLESYEFRLVREALIEREILLASAPHIISPLRLVLPHHPGLRPWPIIRLGLFIYDHLGGRRILPPTRGVDLATDPVGSGLKSTYRRAFEFSDCWVDDARLVDLNAIDAANRGAGIRPRTKAGLSVREVDYLVANEWVETTDDILWRRTKLGPRFPAERRSALNDYTGHRMHATSALRREGAGFRSRTALP